MEDERLRVHLVTLILFSFGLSAVLVVWAFPRFALFVALTAAFAFAYVRLYRFVEDRFATHELAAMEHEPRRKKKTKRKKTKTAAPVPEAAVVEESKIASR